MDCSSQDLTNLCAQFQHLHPQVVRHVLEATTTLPPFPIDFFLLFLLVKGIHGASALERVSPASDQPESRAVGQLLTPPVNPPS
eukprot:1143337-Pelagomonas_calceolata.AAC.1